MKTMVILVSALLVANVSFAKDEASKKETLPVLICQSTEVIEGWNAVTTKAKLTYTAYVESSTSLKKAVVTGAYFSDARDLTASPDPDNQYNRYKFAVLEDAWHWFNLFVPKNFLDIEGTFPGSVQQYFEESYVPRYIDMNCFVKK